MANWCLVKEKADVLLSKLKSNEITYASLRRMESGKRRELFASFMSPDDAKRANLLFEKKLLQKDFFRAMDSWKATLTGQSNKKQERIKALIEKRKSEDIGKVFNPKSNELFKRELASSKVGVDISPEESKMLFALSKKIGEGEKLYDKKTIFQKLSEVKGMNLSKEEESVISSLISKLEQEDIDGNLKKYLASNAYRDLRRAMEEKLSPEKRMELLGEIDKVIKERQSGDYGRSRVALEEYIGELKLTNEIGIEAAVKKFGASFSKKEYASLPTLGAKFLGKVVTEIFGTMKAAKGSFDASAIGRQGLPMLTSGHFKEWVDLVKDNFSILSRAIGGEKDLLKVIRSDIYNTPLGRNGVYDKMKIAIGGKEEQYASTIISKVPGFKQSEEMFTGSLWIARANLANKFYKQMIEDYKKSGIDILSKNQSELYTKELESIGRRINSLTGRGDIGIGKLGKVTSTAFWSPKLIQSNLDRLTGHIFDFDMTENQRKSLFKEWVTRVGLTGGAIYFGSQVFPDKKEYDPRSSKFGTINGIDVTGGAAGYITLIARLFGSKNLNTGVITPLGQYGNTFVDVLTSFVTNKTSPGARLIIDKINGYNFEGDSMKLDFSNKESALNTLWVYSKGTIVPIPIAKFVDGVKNGKEPYALFNMAMAADFLGFSDKNFAYSPNWERSDAKVYKKLKEKYGNAEFRKANREYANEVNKNIDAIRNTDEYKNKSNEEKKKVIDKILRDAKNKVLDKYDLED